MTKNDITKEFQHIHSLLEASKNKPKKLQLEVIQQRFEELGFAVNEHMEIAEAFIKSVRK